MNKVRIGAKVKIKPQHWLRALEDGTVVEYRPQSRHNWLVQFERSYPGGGIDGDKLYFDEAEFSEVEYSGASAAIEPSAVGRRKFCKFSSVPNGVDFYG
jgi:hypothetical protein